MKLILRIVTIALTTFNTVSFAQSKTPPKAASTPKPATAPTASSLASKAEVEFKAGKFKDALTTLEAARSLAGDNKVSASRLDFMTARCLIELHRPDDAMTALDRFISNASSDSDRTLGRTWQDKVQQRFFGGITVGCKDPSHRVTLEEGDFTPQRCPATWNSLTPGKYTVVILSGEDVVERIALEVIAGNTIEARKQTVEDPAEPVDDGPPWYYGVGGLVRTGLSRVTGSLSSALDVSDSLALTAGAYGQVGWLLGDVMVGPRLELAFARWSVNTEFKGQSSGWVTQGVSVPLLLRVGLPWNIEVLAGPGLEVPLSIKIDGEAINRPRTLLRVHAGLGWQTKLGGTHVAFSARWARDLTKPFEGSDLIRHALMFGIEAGL